MLCKKREGICFLHRLERLKLSLEFRNNTFLLALSIAGISRCLHNSQPHYLSPDGLPEGPSKSKAQLKSKTSLHFTLCLFLPSFPLLSCRLLVFFCWLEQSITNQLFLSTAGSCSLSLTFRDEPALARRALMLMGAQKLNRCPNPAHLAVMTNRILFWKRRGEKESGSPY